MDWDAIGLTLFGLTVLAILLLLLSVAIPDIADWISKKCERW